MKLLSRITMIRIGTVLCLFCGQHHLLPGQVSPFNGRAIPAVHDDGYRLVISGHFHGSGRDRSGFPAATLLGNLDRINELAPAIILSTGDLFLEPEKDHPLYDRSFFQRMDLPLFNVPGNHDIGSYYEAHFGPTSMSFSMGNDQIVLLDTERNDGSLMEDQLSLLKALKERSPERIFIVSHRPVWSEGDERYGPLFQGNTRSLIGTNYHSEVWPLLLELAERSEIFWISGSMAGNAPTSFFFQPHAPNITFIQSAIRNTRWDALLIADVRPGRVEWSSFPLADPQALPPQEYNAQWWQQQRGIGEAFNWRLVPYYVRSALMHRMFWYGAVSALLLLLIAWLVLRKRRRPVH